MGNKDNLKEIVFIKDIPPKKRIKKEIIFIR